MTTTCGYQQITSLAASTALTVPLPGAIPSGSQQPTGARITAQAQAVRWRDDGTAPTAAVGYPLAVGTELMYYGDLSAIRFIEQAASAAINVVYFY